MRDQENFSKEFAGGFQRNLLAKNLSLEHHTTEFNQTSDEGASERQGSSSKFKRHSTIQAGQHLTTVSSKSVNEADKKDQRVQGLARKLLALYNV